MFLTNLQNLILNSGLIAGYLIYFLIIFAESGLFFGFFLPGDSLLFTLGLVAAKSSLHIGWLIGLGIIAAISGDSVGYAFGRKIGPAIFKRPDSRFFKQEYVKQAEDFYEEHGKSTIIIARFTPFVRTFAPILAGVARMSYGTFLSYNIIGGSAWITTISLLGYFLGNVIPNIDKYILPIVAVIVVFSILPSFLHLKKSTKQKNND